MLTDLAWMERHVEALFVHDARGRILGCNEPDGAAAPRFHLGRTLHGNLWRIRDDVPRDTRLRLSRMAGREAPLAAGSLSQRQAPVPPERAGAFEKCLAESGPVESIWRGPAFRFPATLPDREAAPGVELVRIADGRDVAIARRHFGWLDAATLVGRTPCLAAVQDGDAVALCHAARGDAHVAAEAGLQTSEPHRGRGYASLVTLAWARAVREVGGEPLYSTSWDNAASRAVARKLGLVCFGEDFHLT